MLDTGLDGRVAIVTGGNHGIGAATARALAAQGVAVFITYLRFPQPEDTAEASEPGEAMYRRRQAMTADEVVQSIRESGGRAESWEVDLSDPEVIPEVFDRAEAAFGPVEILVNNAAHSESDTFVPSSRLSSDAGGHPVYRTRTITAESHDAHFAVNARAVALMMAELARRHVGRGASWGRIVNLSTDGSPGFAGEVCYGASKYATESYSRAAAKELGRYGITVNVVSPGPTQTGWIAPKYEQEWGRGIPMGRVGRPEDVADAIVLLVSEQARWITGQVIFVGGGHRMV